MKTGKIIAGVTAVLMGAVSPAFFIDTDTVYCEKVYDVKLSAETVEIDINDIPENREVQVGISIDNNPGFLGIFYCIEFDSKLNTALYDEYEYDFGKFASSMSQQDNQSKIRFELSNLDLNSLYMDNSLLLKINFILPDDVKAGDFFYVNFSDNFYDIQEPHFCRENSLDSEFGPENFGALVNGGIRITGQSHNDEPLQQPSSQQEQQPTSSSEEHHDSPVQNEQSGSKSEQQSVPENKTQATIKSVTESVTVQETTSVSTSEITTVKSTESTTVQSTSVSETSGVSETVSMTEVTVSETAAEEIKEKSETRSAAPYIAGVFLAVAAAAATVFAVKNKKKDGSK